MACPCARYLASRVLLSPSSFVAERWRKACVVADSFGIVGRVESPIVDAPSVVAEGVDLAESAHDVLAVVHLNDAVVVLIADQGVTVPQTHGARAQWAAASP